MHRLIFVSDIHLKDEREDIVAAFTYFLREVPQSSDELYILGDLFDYWIGDDIESSLTQHISNSFKVLSNRGVKVFFLRGNRDFVIGDAFAKKCGFTIIPPFYRLPYMPKIMLMHGDELCIEDISYQRYKKFIQNPFILTILKNMPVRFRRSLINKIRNSSSQKTDKKIIDVTEEYVEKIFRQYQIGTVIHGHTHRPAIHPKSYGTRYVLGEWDKTGDYLILENNEIIRHSITIESEKVSAYKKVES